MAIRVPVNLDIRGDPAVAIREAVDKGFAGIDVSGVGRRVGAELSDSIGAGITGAGGNDAEGAGEEAGGRYSRGFGRGIGNTIGDAFTAQGSAIARLGGGFTALIGAIAPVPSALAGVVAGAVAIVGAVGQVSGVALSAAGALASLGQASIAIQVGSRGLAEAFDAQAKAQQELAQTGAVSASTQEALTAAMDGLAPAAQRVVTTVQQLTPAWSAMQQAVQQNLFAGAADIMRDISSSILPGLQAGLVGTAQVLNEAAQGFANFITAGGGAEQITSLMQGLNDALAALLPGIGAFGQGFLTLFQGSTGEATALANAITEVGQSFAQWAQGVTESGRLSEFLSQASEVGGTLLGIVANLGSSLISVLGAGADEGASLLDMFENATGQLAAFLQTAEANAGLQTFYSLIQQVGETLGILGGVFGPVFGALGTLLAAIIPNIEALRAALQPLITAIADNLNTAMQGIAPLVGTLLQLVATLVAALAPLVTLIVNILGPALQGIGVVLNAILGPAVTFISELIANFQTGLAGLMAMLAPLQEPLAQLGTALRELVGTALRELNPLFRELMPLLAPLAAVLGPIAVAFIRAFGPVVVNTLRVMIVVLTNTITLITGMVNFVAGILTGDWAQAWRGAAQITSSTLNTIRILLTGLRGNIELIFNGIVRLISGAWNTAITVTRAQIAAVVAAASSILGRLPGSLGTIASTTVQAFGNALSAAVGLVGEIGNQIIASVQGWADGMYAAGQNVVQRVIDGILSMIGSVGSAMSSVAGTIADYLPQSPAKRGPLSGAGDPMKSGQNIIERLSDGMLSRESRLGRAMGTTLVQAQRIGVQERPSDFFQPERVTRPVGQQDCLTLVQNFNGPTTSGQVRSETEWAWKFAPRGTRFSGTIPNGVMA